MKTGKQERRWVLLASTMFAVGACDSMVGVNDPERDDVFGSGIVVTEVRAVAGFTGVRVSGGHTVVVEQAEVEGAEITTDDNLVAFVRTDIIGGTLVVSIDPQVRLVKSRVVCKSERKLLDASVRLPWRPPSVREA